MIGFIGGGNMAEALIKGLTGRGTKDLLFYEPSQQRIKHLMNEYGAGYVGSNREVLNRSNIIIIAVKPQIISSVFDEISDMTVTDKVFVSIAAGITLSYLSKKLSTNRVIRVMPNTPALVQEGMSVISAAKGISAEELETVRDIFGTLGKTLVLPEEKMDAVTALSGSGPGFIAYFVEVLIKGGINIGLTEEEAATLAVQTMVGSAKILQSGMRPERLREMVTSPNGTTFAGLRVMENRDIEGIISEVLEAARARAEELGKDAG